MRLILREESAEQHRPASSAFQRLEHGRPTNKTEKERCSPPKQPASPDKHFTLCQSHSTVTTASAVEVKTISFKSKPTPLPAVLRETVNSARHSPRHGGCSANTPMPSMIAEAPIRPSPPRRGTRPRAAVKEMSQRGPSEYESLIKTDPEMTSS